MPTESVSFGIVPSIDAARGRARLAELCELLGDHAGVRFVPSHHDSYRGLVDAFDRHQIQVGWLPPIASAQFVERGRASILALPIRRGSVSYRSALIARPNGPRSLADLRGRRVAWVDPESSSGYLVPRLMLRSAGLDATSLFGEERFLMSHAAVVEAVATGRSDVGATYCSDTGGRADVKGAWTAATKTPLEVVAMTGAIPNDAIVASVAVPTDVRSKLLRWFMDLPSPEAKRLSALLFGADGFRMVAKEHFDPLRTILSAAKGSLLPTSNA